MNKLNKIFLVIIIFLSIALICMTFAYFNMRKVAEDNLNYFLEENRKVFELNKEIDENNVD